MFTHRPLHKADRQTLVPARGVLPPGSHEEGHTVWPWCRRGHIQKRASTGSTERPWRKDHLVNRGYEEAFVEKGLTKVDTKDREKLSEDVCGVLWAVTGIGLCRGGRRHALPATLAEPVADPHTACWPGGGALLHWRTQRGGLLRDGLGEASWLRQL